MNHIESDNQIALFQWAEYNQAKYPELELLYSIPNGGKRNLLEAVRLKKEGVRAGVPDTFLSVAKGNFHGLYIELKSDKGKLSLKQKNYIEKLREQSYKVAVCYGWEQARDTILRYLKGEE